MIRRLLLAASVAASAWSGAAAQTALQPVARVGPWPGVSELVGFGERLWFVNSVKFVNHNSADLYSYHPGSGEVRYERHLFSQDAGEAAVVGGLIFWPFEDARFSVGRGEFMVSNGRDWRWHGLPEGTVFHVHAMIPWRGALIAATSAWRAGLQRSDDLGATWRILYDHPTEEGYVSRITSLAVLGDALYAGLTAWAQDGIKLLRLGAGAVAVAPLPGWPEGRSTRALSAWRGWLYGVNIDDDGSALWRTDGSAVERVVALDGKRVRALAGGPEALWAITVGEGDGALWRSLDGRAWSRWQTFAGEEPLDVVVHGDRVYMGALGADGRGVLWGPPPPAPTGPAVALAPLPPLPAPLDRDRVPKLLAALDRALADPASYGRGGALGKALRPLGASGLPALGEALARRLAGPFPDAEIGLFGGRMKVSAATVGRWALTRAIAATGGGRLPEALIAAPFSVQPNRAEKYWEIAPAAAFTAALLGQNDAGTLKALVGRLGREGEPDWLAGDTVGALSALSGQRFGYDLAAWRRWLREQVGE